MITPARDALTSAPAMDIRAPVAGTISLMSPTVATKVTRPDFVGASSFLAQATMEPASAAASQILSKRAHRSYCMSVTKVTAAGDRSTNRHPVRSDTAHSNSVAVNSSTAGGACTAGKTSLYTRTGSPEMTP